MKLPPDPEQFIIIPTWLDTRIPGQRSPYDDVPPLPCKPERLTFAKWQDMVQGGIIVKHVP